AGDCDCFAVPGLPGLSRGGRGRLLLRNVGLLLTALVVLWRPGGGNEAARGGWLPGRLGGSPGPWGFGASTRRKGRTDYLLGRILGRSPRMASMSLSFSSPFLKAYWALVLRLVYMTMVTSASGWIL